MARGRDCGCGLPHTAASLGMDLSCIRAAPVGPDSPLARVHVRSCRAVPHPSASSHDPAGVPWRPLCRPVLDSSGGSWRLRPASNPRLMPRGHSPDQRANREGYSPVAVYDRPSILAA